MEKKVRVVMVLWIISIIIIWLYTFNYANNLLLIIFLNLLYIPGSYMVFKRHLELVSEETKKRSDFYSLDNLKDGFHFEEYTAQLLEALKYNNVKVLQRSNDYGADVLAEYNGVKYAIQCKYYTSQTVGVRAVQEILGGTAYHNADVPVVATNYKFSPNAVNLAKANNVTLWDRENFLKKESKAAFNQVNNDHLSIKTDDGIQNKKLPNNYSQEMIKETIKIVVSQIVLVVIIYLIYNLLKF